MGYASRSVLVVACCVLALGCGDNDNDDNDNTPGGRTPTPTTGRTSTPATTASAPTPAATATGPTPAATASAAPMIPCPVRLTYIVEGTASDLDAGFTGFYFDQPLGDGGSLSFALDCPGSFLGACGECALSGPIASTTFVDNQRCQNATETICSTDAECPGSSCEFFFGAPLPVSGGGFPVCVVNQVSGNVTGTVSPELGSGASDFDLSLSFFSGLTIDRPCPTCSGATVGATGTCEGGARNGAACTTHGTTAIFGNTSFDCPPSAAGNIGNSTVALDLTTGTRTLAPATSCTDSQFTGRSCYCENQPRANACADNVCTVAADGEGTCQAGPADSVCQTEFFRTCMSNADCPAAGDSCGIKTRGCLGPTDATGSATGPVTRTGIANRTQPLQVATFCIAATSSPAVNSAGGLPGPAGLRLLTDVCIEESCP